MTQNNNDRTDSFNIGQEESNYNEQYSLWKENMKSKLGTNTPKMSEKIPLSKFGVGFLILLILLMLLFARKRSTVLEHRIGALEKSVKNVEEMVEKLNVDDNRVTQDSEQVQTFQQFRESVGRSEAALTSRMDQIAVKLDSLQRQMSKAPTQKANTLKAAKESKKTTSNRYHIVKPGETLYQIGPQYGLTVKKLRQLNKLGNSDTIYPGQKLVIRP
jgi:LysM repeat protein